MPRAHRHGERHSRADSPHQRPRLLPARVPQRGFFGFAAPTLGVVRLTTLPSPFVRAHRRLWPLIALAPGRPEESGASQAGATFGSDRRHLRNTPLAAAGRGNRRLREHHRRQ